MFHSRCNGICMVSLTLRRSNPPGHIVASSDGVCDVWEHLSHPEADMPTMSNTTSAI